MTISKKKAHIRIKPEKIIVAHRNPDFDAFSATVGANLLFPDHVIIHSGEGSNNLQEFMTIYEEKFPFYMEKEVDYSSVREVVICDTSIPERLGKKIQTIFKNPDIKVRIYDHHPVDTSRIFPNQTDKKIFLEEIGSSSTLIVEELQRKNTKIKVEASTLLAIGIYEDTGNFLFSSTTPRDMQACAYLLEKKANIDVISAFVKTEMTPDQLDLMKELEENIVSKIINKVEIHISTSEIEGFVGGLNLITSKIWLSKGFDTFISVVKMGEKTYLVGRTLSPDVNLGELMGKLRGGGHKRAAACKMIDVTLEEALERLNSELVNFVSAAVKASDIMSYPVKTLLAKMQIKRAHKIMNLTGYGGIPIIEADNLVGIVVRRDVQKAMDHGLGSNPVKSIMSTNLVVADWDDSVELVKQKMIENGVGRIPVIRNGILAGLITRTDIIREVYHQEKRHALLVNEESKFYNVKNLMLKNLSLELFRFLESLGEVAEQIGYKIFIVGGFVRDLLLGFDNLDIDIVVEGNAIEFTEKLKGYKSIKAEVHNKFLTSKVFFTEEEIDIDFATARTEYYEYPGALPNVDQAHLKKDLYRRDFTINAMAIALNTGSFGRLIDYFGSRRDIESGNIKILYNTSFIDDPTRILRGIRYEQRYDFTLEERTLEHLEKALEDEYLEKISGGRIRYELNRILDEENRVDMLKRLGELNVIKHLFPQTYYTHLLSKKIERTFASLKWFEIFYSGSYTICPFYCLLYILCEYYTQDQLDWLKDNYGIPKKTTNELYHISKFVEILAKLFTEEMPFSDIYSTIEGISPEGYCYLAAYLDESGLTHLKEYLRTRKRIKLYSTSGKRLIREFGIEPGEKIKEIIKHIVKKKLDGLLTKPEEEETYLQQFVKENYQRE